MGLLGAVDLAGDLAEGTVKLTDLSANSATWPLSKLLILSSSADRFRLQNPRILLNLTVPTNSITKLLYFRWQSSYHTFVKTRKLTYFEGG